MRRSQIAVAAAAAVAGGEGIGDVQSIPSPLSLSPSFCFCPADVYPCPELAALGGLGLLPITLSLKPSSLCKTTQGRKTEAVWACVSAFGGYVVLYPRQFSPSSVVLVIMPVWLLSLPHAVATK